MIRFGFQIIGDEIFDTKIQSYKIVAECQGENIIYSMVKSGYKRLYLFEPLLFKYDIDTVFEMLNFNSYLKESRIRHNLLKTDNFHQISNMATVYNYPPTFLTQRRFSLYKKCQNLKKRID